MGIPIPPDEPERLENLLSLEVLDTRINYQLETITQIASRTFGAPIALVSLVDSERQWFKAKWGLDVSETPREQAFCAHAIMDRETMVVKDATEDERFSSNPLVTGDPSIRFYAGAPLVTQSGYSIGGCASSTTNPDSRPSTNSQPCNSLRHWRSASCRTRPNTPSCKPRRNQ